MSSIAGYTTKASQLRRLSDGEEAAWEEFYSKYRAMIFGIGAQRGLNRDECEDLLQEVAMICCRKLQDFLYVPEQCRFRSFLFRVAENVAFNIGRRKKRRECAEPAADYSAVPELDLQIMQEYERFLLDRSFRVLKESVDSETFLAFDMLCRQELPVPEVVAATGKSAGALYSIKHRCLKKLRDIIGGLSCLPETQQ